MVDSKDLDDVRLLETRHLQSLEAILSLDRALATIPQDAPTGAILKTVNLHLRQALGFQAIAFLLVNPKSFAHELCRQMAADSPERYLIAMAKADRVGRIFLDYLRNDRAATAVAPMSPRGRPGALVSMPISWSQVRKGLDPARFTLGSAPALLKKTKPWSDYREAERPFLAAARKLLQSR